MKERVQVASSHFRTRSLDGHTKANGSALFIVRRKELVLGFLLIVLFSTLANAQGDPLNPVNMPAIDQNASHYPSNIWITGPLAKVRQDAGSPGTVHWAVVYGTQNEFQSFQVHVQAPSAGIANLSVTMSDLLNSHSGTSISASSTDIVVYREAYMNVTQKTATGVAFYNSTGFYPDILIPAIDPYYHQTTSAFPFNVAANQNQSAWIDVHIPASAPSGYYSGQVTVKSGPTVLATMPVVYAVWQWPASQGGKMPSTATLKNLYGKVIYTGFCVQVYGSGPYPYPGGAGDADSCDTMSGADGASMLLDNRLTMVGSNMFPGANTSGWSAFDALYGPQLSGTPGHVSTILSGAKLTTWQIACAGNCNVLGANGNWPTSTFSNFASHFNAKGWSSTLFNYLCDEPPPGGGNCGQFPSVNPWQVLCTNATSEHSSSNPIVPTLVTIDMASVLAHNSTTGCSPDATKSIDWMVPNIVTLEPVGVPLTAGQYTSWATGTCCGGSPQRLFASYLSCSSAGTCNNGTVGNLNYPNFDIDGVPIANRAMQWMTFFHGQKLELYYAIDSQFCTSGCNPWNGVYTFGNNGDGDLVYPCSASRCGITTPIWLPSLRLKMIRDGMQDYEYLNVLTNSGKGVLAQSQIACWITNSYTYNINPTSPLGAFSCDLTDARQALGNALHGLTYSVSLLPPTNLSNLAK